MADRTADQQRQIAESLVRKLIENREENRMPGWLTLKYHFDERGKVSKVEGDQHHVVR